MIVDIPFYEGYAVNPENGLIYSHKSGRYLATHLNNKGYTRTTISLNGIKTHIFNHITVVAVVGDCNGSTYDNINLNLRDIGKSIDHLNCDKDDPRRLNLELVTHSVNIKRMYKNKAKKYDIPDL